MPDQLTQSLDAFIQQCLTAGSQNPDFLTIEFDKDWPSPCYSRDAENGEVVNWQPVKQTGNNNFNGLEEALDIKLHADFVTWFTRYFSFHLPAKAEQGNCELLQVCSDEDFERLQENLIGHIMMKRRLKQPATLFFALTDDDDYLISLDNSTGEVLLERVGKRAEQVLAPSMADFLSALTPRT